MAEPTPFVGSDGVVLSDVVETGAALAETKNHPPAKAVPLLRKEGSQKKRSATPEEISKMRFADIACGSGSFLLGIFDYLIKYHVDWYDDGNAGNPARTSATPTKDSADAASGVAGKGARVPSRRRAAAIKAGLCRETAEGNLQLTLTHKRDILLNNIYGVDLDAQAVEVAQLSLYLKLLEEETTATAQQYLAGFREQLLPNLNKNIVHGNSLIDYDIMDGQLFDSRDLKKLNPMSFQSTFPEVFRPKSEPPAVAGGLTQDSEPPNTVSDVAINSDLSNARLQPPAIAGGSDLGGFDAIVGNPPYRMLRRSARPCPCL